MGYLLTFAIAILLGFAIGLDIAKIQNNKRHSAVNAEYDGFVREELNRLEAERDDYRDNPRVPVGGIGGLTRGMLS
jgi:hypothetical protein